MFYTTKTFIRYLFVHGLLRLATVVNPNAPAAMVSFAAECNVLVAFSNSYFIR
jgi:hypothetical protein